MRDAGMVFVAEDLAAWLVGVLADAARRRLTAWVLASDQERALRRAATAAVQLTAAELRPDGGEQAEELAMVVSQVFGEPVPEVSLSGQATLLEALQTGITRQLAPLGDPGLSGTEKSSAEVLEVPVPVLAEKLTGHLMREIVARGLRGGPLAPLAEQLNHDVTHLYLQQLEGTVGRLAAELRAAARPEIGTAAAPVLESARPHHGDVMALMRAQVRATDELPYRLFGVRRPPLSSVYVRQSLSGGVASPGSALADPACSLEEALARHRHLIVIGGPGQGKSTLTLHLVHRLARDWLVTRSGSAGDHRDPAGLMPLRVTGRELAAAIHHPWLQALCNAARNELGGHLDLEADFSSDLLKKPVGGIPWLIAIDGLDEAVEPERRDRLVTVLSARFAEAALPHRLLVTSRPLHPTEMARLRRDAGANEVGVYELEPFNAAALQDLARRWLTDGPQPPGVDPATRFLQETQINHLADVLSTPLLALMAIALFEENPEGTLPRFKYDLYERYLGYVLTAAVRHPDWRAVTTELAELTGDSGHALHDPVTVEALLQHLAAIQVSSGTPLIVAAYEWLTGNTGPALRRPPEWQAIVESILTRSGLLVRRGSRWEFIHYSFAEHLAAVAEAAKMPGKFDPSDPVLHECINRAGDPFTDIGLIILIHWVRRVPSVGSALLTWLQQGHWHHQELAARLLTSGVAGQAQHLDSACQAIQHRVVLLEEGQGQPIGLLAALARQYPAAVDALNRISANSMVPTWARASALAAAIQIRGLDAEEAASALRGLLDERRAGAGWSQVIAAEALLHMGGDFHAEAIQILREILADPYTHTNAKENAATALSGSGPDLRAEALAALRAIITDPLADCHDRRFAARGLSRVGFPAEAASALNAILADPQAGARDKALTSFAFQEIPRQYRGETIAAFKAMMDDATADPNERWEAAWALVRISSDHRPEAIGILREDIDDPSCDPQLRADAAESIASLAPEHLPDTIQALKTILGDRLASPWTRLYAARTIVRLDFDEYEEVIGMLTEWANSSSDPDHRFVAARGLAAFGPALHSDALTTFRVLLADPAVPLSTRCDAAGSLGELAPDSHDEAVQILRELAADPRARADDLLKAARNLLTLSRASDAEAATWLITALNDVTAESWTRAEVADQLLQLQTADPHAGINVLRTILNDVGSEKELRIWGARRLAKCGSQYREEALAALTRTYG